MKLPDCRILTAAAAALVFALPAQAQEVDNRNNVYVGGQYYDFDSEYQQKSDRGWLFGGEVPLTERWSLNAEYTELRSDLINAAGRSDVSALRIGSNYHFNRFGQLQPYAGFAVGRLFIEPDAAPFTRSSTFDVVVGAKYMLTENLMLRGDVKTIFPSGNAANNLAVGLSVGYAFGRATTRPAAAPPSPAPAPAAEEPVATEPRCPPSDPAFAVDEDGCVIFDTNEVTQTLNVQFDFDRSSIRPEFNSAIREFAEFLNFYEDTNVVIEGHTDSVGTESYNQGLSERRANAVMNELIRQGVAASRLRAVGYGESRPLATNDTAAGRAQNRRIDAVVSVEVEEPRLRQ